MRARAASPRSAGQQRERGERHHGIARARRRSPLVRAARRRGRRGARRARGASGASPALGPPAGRGRVRRRSTATRPARPPASGRTAPSRCPSNQTSTHEWASRSRTRYSFVSRVVEPGREAGRDARGDADHAQHQRHRAGELLAVADLVLEQERRERVVARSAGARRRCTRSGGSAGPRGRRRRSVGCPRASAAPASARARTASQDLASRRGSPGALDRDAVRRRTVRRVAVVLERRRRHVRRSSPGRAGRAHLAGRRVGHVRLDRVGVALLERLVERRRRVPSSLGTTHRVRARDLERVPAIGTGRCEVADRDAESALPLRW